MNKPCLINLINFMPVFAAYLLLAGNAYGQAPASSQKGYMSDKYSQAANAYRTAASNTRCPERKQYFLNMATYMGCLEEQLKYGSTVSCTQPLAMQVPDCPADMGASSTPSQRQASNTNLSATGTAKPLGDGLHDVGDILSSLAVVMDDSASALDTFRAINKLNGSPMDQLGANLPISPKAVVEGLLSLADQKDDKPNRQDRGDVKLKEPNTGTELTTDGTSSAQPLNNSFHDVASTLSTLTTVNKEQRINTRTSNVRAFDFRRHSSYLYTRALIEQYFKESRQESNLNNMLSSILINYSDDFRNANNLLNTLPSPYSHNKPAYEIRNSEFSERELKARKKFIEKYKFDLNYLLKSVLAGDTLTLDSLQNRGFDLQNAFILEYQPMGYDLRLTVLDLAVLNNDYGTSRYLIETKKVSIGYEAASSNLKAHRFVGHIGSNEILLSSSFACAIATANMDIIRMFLKNGYNIKKRVGMTTKLSWKLTPPKLAQLFGNTDLALFFEQLGSSK